MTAADRDELRRLALTTLFPGFEGTREPPPWVVRLATAGLGGVVLFGRNVDPTREDSGVAELTAALRDAGPNLLVAIDEEGGDVTRLDVSRGSSSPGNSALGALDDVTATEQVAAQLGARLRGCGIDINFAPVADVDSNAHSPVIGVRSFGSDPEVVARHVTAFVTGQQRHRVAATVKHFPGHGGTRDDSHVTVPLLDRSLDEIRRLELPPFRAALKSDVKLVMTAHVLVPAIDADIPATLSTATVTGLLREELGYDGTVVTDGLDMSAIADGVGHKEAGVRALQAGVDAMCLGGDTVEPDLVEAMAEAMVEAVLTGRLPVQRLEDAAARIRSLQLWCREAPSSSLASVPTNAAVDAARRALWTHGDVHIDDAPVVLELHDEPSPAAGDVPWGMGAALAARVPGTVVLRLRDGGQNIGEVLAELPERRVVISVRAAQRYPWQARLVQKARARRPDLIVVDHGVASPPDVLGDNYIRTYGAARVTAEAAADVMTGATSR